MKITETNITIGALIERLEATGKPRTTKARALIIIEDESGQTREDIRESVAQFRASFKDISSEEIEQIIGESRRAVRARSS